MAARMCALSFKDNLPCSQEFLYSRMADEKMNVFEQHIQELSGARREGNRKGEGIAYLNLGDYYYGLAHFEQAKRDYREALRIFKEIGYSAGKGKACGNLGIAYHSLSNFKKAKKYFKKQLSIAKQVRDRDQEGNANCNLGNAYWNLGNFKRALEYHEQHLKIAKEVGDRAKEGEAKGNLGNTYARLGNFKQAIVYHKQALSISKEVDNRAGERATYANLGNVNRSLGNFKEAIEYHKQHLSIVKEVGDRAGEGKANCNLGEDYGSLGNFKQAIVYQKQALTIFKEVGDRAGEGIANGSLGSAYHNLGNFKQAIVYYKQHLTIAKEVGDRAGEGMAIGNLGNAYRSLGNCKQALEYHKEDLSIAKEVGARAGEGTACCNLGITYHNLGNFKEAIDYQKQCLSITKEVGDRAGEGRAYGNLGVAYGSLGMFNQAIEYFKHCLSIAKEVGDWAREGTTYGNLGSAYGSLGNFEQAIEYLKQHLSIAKEVGDRATEGTAYGNLGSTYRILGNFEQAIKYIKQNLSIAKEVEDRAGEGLAYLNLGYIYCSRGDVENAILFYEQGLNIAKETEDPVKEGMACYNLGFVHEFSGSLCKALNFYRQSIKNFSETRRLLQFEYAWKISFRDTYQIAYTALWRALLKNGEVDEALYIAEQGRAQTFSDILKAKFGVDKKPPSAVNTRKETISAVLEYLPTQTVFTALDGNKISFWLLGSGSGIIFRQKEIKKLSANSLLQTTLKQMNVGAAVQCENRTLDKVHSDFFFSREAVAKTFQSLSLSDNNSLQPLYDVLISPIEDLLQGDDLIFVPDGPFCLAPYSALSDSVRIRTVPSLTALKLIASAPDNFYSKSEALLVGDPWLKEVTDENGEPIAEQLPCAIKEVEMIGELLQTAPLTGINATKAEVLKRIKSAALVHIAAHGDPRFGEIALTPNPQRTSQVPEKEDFMLSVSDVHAVGLRARLVVLSSCHSGQGEVNSEGVVGIARAFLCAGARSVLVSLWAIDDEATLLFMKSFYRHLADRKSASLALHYAMKSLRETEKYSAIKYWAPFVLIGDDVTLEFGHQKLRKNETASKT
ncbi:tetratricopeptide repeat protein 28-like isoform X1 [Montipora capricornis]|uniref:tetratricopeptide repeat protein 28-like isoform X1 n=2 Tax=Montipora capricornis TaxID=246305 RepID=UPI0035F123A6